MENLTPPHTQKNFDPRSARVSGRSRGGRLRSARTPLGDPNSSLIRWSTRRLVVSGDTFELYTYPRPYFYNWGPRGRTSSEGIKRADKKRDDHILRARRQIRRLINANLATQVPKFITLTFAKNIHTLKEANPQFTRFQKELQRRYGRGRYLCVPEFQKRGAVHFHVIYFDLPYIKNIKSVMAKLWGKGWVKVIAVREIRNIGAYVSKYLQKGVGDKRTVGHKGYFRSRGMLLPEEFRAEESIDKKLLGYTFKSEAVEQFEGRQGAILYQRFKITTAT